MRVLHPDVFEPWTAVTSTRSATFHRSGSVLACLITVWATMLLASPASAAVTCSTVREHVLPLAVKSDADGGAEPVNSQRAVSRCRDPSTGLRFSLLNYYLGDSLTQMALRQPDTLAELLGLSKLKLMTSRTSERLAALSEYVSSDKGVGHSVGLAMQPAKGLGVKSALQKFSVSQQEGDEIALETRTGELRLRLESIAGSPSPWGGTLEPMFFPVPRKDLASGNGAKLRLPKHYKLGLNKYCYASDDNGPMSDSCIFGWRPLVGTDIQGFGSNLFQLIQIAVRNLIQEQETWSRGERREDGNYDKPEVRSPERAFSNFYQSLGVIDVTRYLGFLANITSNGADVPTDLFQIRAVRFSANPAEIVFDCGMSLDYTIEPLAVVSRLIVLRNDGDRPITINGMELIPGGATGVRPYAPGRVGPSAGASQTVTETGWAMTDYVSDNRQPRRAQGEIGPGQSVGIIVSIHLWRNVPGFFEPIEREGNDFSQDEDKSKRAALIARIRSKGTESFAPDQIALAEPPTGTDAFVFGPSFQLTGIDIGGYGRVPVPASAVGDDKASVLFAYREAEAGSCPYLYLGDASSPGRLGRLHGEILVSAKGEGLTGVETVERSEFVPHLDIAEHELEMAYIGGVVQTVHFADGTHVRLMGAADAKAPNVLPGRAGAYVFPGGRLRIGFVLPREAIDKAVTRSVLEIPGYYRRIDNHGHLHWPKGESCPIASWQRQ